MLGHARQFGLIAIVVLSCPRAYSQQSTPDATTAVIQESDTVTLFDPVPLPDTMKVAPVLPVRFISTSFYGSFNASYAASENWGGSDQKNFAFFGNALYRHGAYSGNRSHSHQIMADLGYLKFVDSIWVKNIDRLQMNLLWCNMGKHFSHSYMIAFGTQFLSSDYLDYDYDTGRLTKHSVGGLLNPFSLEAGYGTVFTFWNTSNINFALATLRLNGSPKELTPSSFVDGHAIEGHGAYYFLSYGFCVSTAINKRFGDHVQWINNSRFFGNGMDRDHVNMDFSNMVVVKLWKYVQLRADTRLVYNPLLNYSLQFRQEVLIGFFYERDR